MNQCHFMGRLGADPELRTVGGDKQVVNFRIAVERKYKRGKETARETAWVPCEAWDTGAQLIEKHFKKGNFIIVHGSIKEDAWDDKNTGEKRSKLKLRVEKFDFVPGNNNGDETKTRPSAPQGDAERGGGGDDGDGGNDPIPF